MFIQKATRMYKYFILILFAISSCVSPSKIRLNETNLIWNKAEHNAFTTLISYNDYLYCAFREGTSHHSYDGGIRIIKSKDTQNWENVAFISIPQEDLRDPKFIINNNDLNLIFVSRTETEHYSYSYSTKNGVNWSQENKEDDTWRWNATELNGIIYSVGYSSKDKKGSIYTTEKGKSWQSIKEDFFPDVDSYPNETALFFSSDGTSYAFVRQDKKSKSALIGTSNPPYQDWTWKDLNARVGSPSGILVNDSLILACVRLYFPVRTSLVWIDPIKGTLKEDTVLPSGGDTGYASIASFKDKYYVSYNSSKNLENRSSIYLSEFSINVDGKD